MHARRTQLLAQPTCANPQLRELGCLGSPAVIVPKSHSRKLPQNANHGSGLILHSGVWYCENEEIAPV